MKVILKSKKVKEALSPHEKNRLFLQRRQELFHAQIAIDFPSPHDNQEELDYIISSLTPLVATKKAVLAAKKEVEECEEEWWKKPSKEDLEVQFREKEKEYQKQVDILSKICDDFKKL